MGCLARMNIGFTIRLIFCLSLGLHFHISTSMGKDVKLLRTSVEQYFGLVSIFKFRGYLLLEKYSNECLQIHKSKFTYIRDIRSKCIRYKKNNIEFKKIIIIYDTQNDLIIGYNGNK